MKHLPNLLTLANLFCGCIAIAYILSAQPYLSMSVGHAGLPTWQWINGAQQMYLGSLFIFIAAVCDMLDGMVARALKVFSPIGKDLDSLADIVSFGVAPSTILFKLLWDSLTGEKNAFDINMLGMAPAFLIACFGALRLAKFNITSDAQKGYFIGMPIPAVGLFVATFPLILWFSPAKVIHYVSVVLQNKWGVYAIIAILCWLMVSKIKFLKLVPGKMSIGQMWPQLLIVATAIGGYFVLGYAAFPLAFILYVLLSIIHKFPEAAQV